MATLDPTVGGAAANTYATLEEANAYFSDHLYPWSGADEQKTDALVMATRVLDALAGRPVEWTGASTTAQQRLAWPRTGMANRNGYAIDDDVIPRELKEAQCEIARSLLIADRTLDSAIETQGITSVKAGPVAVTFRDDVKAKVIPDAAWTLLPHHWYDEIETEDVLFEVM